MSGEIIRQGDRTSHGGTVLEGSAFDICHGKPIAYVGHKVFCPKCKGAFPIIEGALTTTFYGKGVALAGMKTACGAVLIPTQFTDVVKYGGGSDASSEPEAESEQAATEASASNADMVAAAGWASGDASPAKSIKRIYWTYGPDELPLGTVSRHYVDLNLHIETQDYAPGDRAHVLIENEDGSELTPGCRVLELQAVVASDGTAKLNNVFRGKTVNIGILG